MGRQNETLSRILSPLGLRETTENLLMRMQAHPDTLKLIETEEEWDELPPDIEWWRNPEERDDL